MKTKACNDLGILGGVSSGIVFSDTMDRQFELIVTIRCRFPHDLSRYWS